MAIMLMTGSSFAGDYKNYDIDNNEHNKKFDIQLKSGKKNSVRFYRGIRDKEVLDSIQNVFKSVTNFADRCNNEYKERRKLTNKNTNCKYPNGNLIESVIHKSTTSKYAKEENEVDRYVIERRIYNRQSWSHVDLVKVFHEKDEKGRKVIRIAQTMLSEKDSKKYLSKPVDTESVFMKAIGIYTLTEISDHKTLITYQYTSETDHWLLNKSVSVSKVFESMAKSIDSLMVSIQKELAYLSQSNYPSKEVASNLVK